MKIGIITFHSSLNCGSMLQAYALQTVLEKRYGADVEIINFSNSGSRNMYSIIDKRPKKSAIRNNIKSILILEQSFLIGKIIFHLRKNIFMYLQVIIKLQNN